MYSYVCMNPRCVGGDPGRRSTMSLSSPLTGHVLLCVPGRYVTLTLTQFCEYDRSRETLLNQVAAGALTGVIQVAATNPMEIVKLRLQVQAAAGGAAAAQQLTPGQIVRELGPRGLYKGSMITIARDVPYNVVFFTSYIAIKRWLTDEQGHVTLPRIMASGVIAGMIGACLGTPVDVVKTRIQARGSDYTKGAPAAARRILAEEGYRAFFTGSVPRMAVQGPLYGIALLAFEVQQAFLGGTST